MQRHVLYGDACLRHEDPFAIRNTKLNRKLSITCMSLHEVDCYDGDLLVRRRLSKKIKAQ